MIVKPTNRDFAQDQRIEAVERGATIAIDVATGTAHGAGKVFKWIGFAVLFFFVWITVVGLVTGLLEENAAPFNFLVTGVIAFGAWKFFAGKRQSAEAFATVIAALEQPGAISAVPLHASDNPQPKPSSTAMTGAKPGSQRPRAITWFDGLYFTTLAVNLVYVFQILPLLRERLDSDPMLAQVSGVFEMMFGLIVFGLLQMVVLWFCVSRFRSNIARWILILTTAVSAFNALFRHDQMVATDPLVWGTAIVGALLSIGAMACLFAPSARDWFAEKRMAKQTLPDRSLAHREATVANAINIPQSFGRKTV